MNDALLGIHNQPRIEDDQDVLEIHSNYVYELQDAIYSEARQRKPANEREAASRGQILVKRLLRQEEPWAGIAAIASELSKEEASTSPQPGAKSPSEPDDDQPRRNIKVKLEKFADWDSDHGEWLAIRSRQNCENDDELEFKLLDCEEELALQMATMRRIGG